MSDEEKARELLINAVEPHSFVGNSCIGVISYQGHSELFDGIAKALAEARAEGPRKAWLARADVSPSDTERARDLIKWFTGYCVCEPQDTPAIERFAKAFAAARTEGRENIRELISDLEVCVGAFKSGSPINPFTPISGRLEEHLIQLRASVKPACHTKCGWKSCDGVQCWEREE